MPAVPVMPPQVINEGPRRKRFTREEVERLLDAGVFAGQRFELIDGDLIDKMGQNPPHAIAIRRLLKWLSSLFDSDLILIQLPMEVADVDRERSLPEPDLAVVGEWSSEHLHRHPRGNEMRLVIEVSETTAAFDLSRKVALYAHAGVPLYWVLDLTRRMLIVHREPDGTKYRHIDLYSEEDIVSLEGAAGSVKVADILPPRT